MKKQFRCPQCDEETFWQDNPHRPFCSQRCQLIDLGQWADESYRVPVQEQDPFSDDKIA